MDLIYHCDKPFVDIFFHLREIGKQTLGTIQKKALYFEQRERNNANTLGGGSCARGQKPLQKHFYCIHFAVLTFFFIPLPLLCSFKVATEL